MSLHHHDHEHDHGHGHHHHVPADGHSRAFAIGVVLNLAFVAIEAGYGWKTGSLALLADAGHNLSDVAGLLVAWAGLWAGRLRPNARHTYGWKRGTVLAAFVNAIFLLLAMGALIWEALQRFSAGNTPDGMTIIVVAAIGVVINTATALLFMRGQHDLNIRGAYLHMAADALVSVGVVISGLLLLWFGWSWIDPLVSLVIAVVIIIGTWGLLRQSVRLLFDGVPAHIDVQKVHAFLAAQPGVSQVHDLHIWALGTTEIALTAHLVMPDGNLDDEFLHRLGHDLEHDFGISHATIQVERRSMHCGGCEQSFLPQVTA